MSNDGQVNGALSSGAFGAVVVGSLLPSIVLTASFTATGPSPVAAAPSGVANGTLAAYPSGNPTTATVVLEGSLDGLSWAALASLPGAAVFLRLNCTALAGGTSPTVVAVAIASP